MVLFCFFFAALLVQGCSYQAWYEGFRARERNECYKHLNNSDIDACLERVNSMNYKEYQKSKNN